MTEHLYPSALKDAWSGPVGFVAILKLLDRPRRDMSSAEYLEWRRQLTPHVRIGADWYDLRPARPLLRLGPEYVDIERQEQEIDLSAYSRHEALIALDPPTFEFTLHLHFATFHLRSTGPVIVEYEASRVLSVLRTKVLRTT